jgi:hypothetical protein
MNGMLADAKAQLLEEGHDLSALDACVAALRQADSGAVAKLLENFHLLANPLPFLWDIDYGALVLEFLAEESPDAARAKLMIEHALRRAQWCASCATSGGEGTARMRDVHRLEQRWQAMR